MIGVGLLVSYQLSTDQYTLFLGRHKDVLDAIRRRRPAISRILEYFGGRSLIFSFRAGIRFF